MKVIKDMPIFPVIDINFNWENLNKGLVPVYTDKYIYTSSKDIFKEYYFNHLVVDSDYNIYKIIQNKEVSFLRRYIYCKSELFFKKEDEKYSFEEIKNYIIESIRKLNEKNNSEKNNNIIREIMIAKSFEDICYSKKLNYKYY
jgi:hypothetical protein